MLDPTFRSGPALLGTQEPWSVAARHNQGVLVKTSVEFRSARCLSYDGEDERLNPGLWGRRLVEYLVEKLSKLDIATQDPIAEDWGWYIPIRFRLANLLRPSVRGRRSVRVLVRAQSRRSSALLDMGVTHRYLVIVLVSVVDIERASVGLAAGQVVGERRIPAEWVGLPGGPPELVVERSQIAFSVGYVQCLTEGRIRRGRRQTEWCGGWGDEARTSGFCTVSRDGRNPATVIRSVQRRSPV